MTVESWDPSATGLTSSHRDILNQVVTQIEKRALELGDTEQAFLRPVMLLDADEWRSFVSRETDESIEAWIKVLTLIERDFSGFEAGSRSPVLTLIKVLKSRNALPDGLFAWIKSHTRNRFLPYGSLADRL
ncbi:MAG: hypothetical protein OXG15_15725 [Gammaproteobacteria bacterium]|nr:hypothetical protein [Gammaproteobacteria bacterium]